MEVILIGGFLGSGKTTVVNRMLRGLTARGGTAAVVENELGTVGVDDALVARTGVQVTPLFGGCVCCQIAGDLLAAVGQIQAQVDPDYLVVEMTGLALMDGIRDVFARYGGGGLSLHTVSVVDMARWPKLIRAMGPVVRRQLAGADLVLVNKTDVAPAAPEALEEISTLAGGAPVRSISAANLEDEALWDLIKEALL